MTPEVEKFAQTLEEVCIKTVESGQMTKDLALLVGADQAFLTTDEFLDVTLICKKQWQISP